MDKALSIARTWDGREKQDWRKKDKRQHRLLWGRGELWALLNICRRSESDTRNPGMMLVKCFNELEVILQCIFSWHQQALHNGYYITALQLQILSFGLFVCLFFSLPFLLVIFFFSIFPLVGNWSIIALSIKWGRQILQRKIKWSNNIVTEPCALRSCPTSNRINYSQNRNSTKAYL